MERPILFSTAMVRALLDGQKTQTRRVINPQPPTDAYQLATLISTTGDQRQEGKQHWVHLRDDGYTIIDETRPYFACPYGKPGDLLWVREAHVVESNLGIDDEAHYPPPFSDGRPIRRIKTWDDEYWEQCHYRATDEEPELSCEKHEGPCCHWRPSIHMPRWASRVLLVVTDVRVQRVQEIGHEDAIAEGIDRCNRNVAWIVQERFKRLWDSINATRGFGWDANPFVWAVTFEVKEEVGGNE